MASLTFDNFVQRERSDTGLIYATIYDADQRYWKIHDVWYSTTSEDGPWETAEILKSDPEYAWPYTGSAAGKSVIIPIRVPEMASTNVWLRPNIRMAPFENHATLDQGLRNYWPCYDNEATPVVEDKYHGQNGALTAGNTNAISVAGAIDLALDLDVVQIDLSAAERAAGEIFHIDKPFSTSFWVNPAVDGGAQLLAGTLFWGPIGWSCYMDDTDWSIEIGFVGLFDQFDAGTAAGAITAGAWNHVVITYNGSSLYTGIGIYVAGVDVVAFGNPSGGTFSISSDTFHMGGAGGDDDYDVCEIGLWNKELTQAEVTALYAGGSGLPM